MAMTFQSSQPDLAQPKVDLRTGVTTTPAQTAPTDARQQYLDQQKAREATQTAPTDARQQYLDRQKPRDTPQTTPPAVTRDVAPTSARTPAVVTFIPYAETVQAQKAQGGNLALWAVGGLLAYQLLKK